MKKNFLLSITLCFSLLFCLAVPAAFANSVSEDETLNNGYSITDAYEYPLQIDTGEWKEIQSSEEKVKVSQIPESILYNMTTEALVETVMNYPLMVTMYAFDTEQAGFNAVYSTFNGLQELTKRSDAAFELERYRSNTALLKTTDTKIIVQSYYAETLLAAIGSNSRVSSDSVITPYFTNSSVTTPRGTSVPTFKDLTWADHGYTSAQGAAIQAQFVAAFPNATVLSAQNPSYNCHSYAWYSTSSANTHWMNSSSGYRTDGSYTSGTARVGSKVDYGAGDHSAIVTYVGGGSGPNITVKSKWGHNGVFSHNIVDSPYTMGAYSCTFWN
ncbi:hypothetical protein [Paenibacillus sp. sgz500992]|uniref:hypothetical protein n=1 Tax=Paenibacillus sp. sgz500992 TaxID=3242476 RepID=UPI0036D23A35